MIEWTISIGNLLTIVGMISAVSILFGRLGTRLDVVERDLSSIRDSLKEVAKNTHQAAMAEGRMLEIEKRVDIISARLDNHIQRMARNERPAN